MQKLQLSIPEPCHENWQTMTPTEQGRFCNSCAKEVIDFSMMTDTEVLNYFTTLTHEKVCGRALPAQLDRAIIRTKEPKKRLFWYWNYIVMFLMFFGKANNIKAHGRIKTTTQIAFDLKTADCSNTNDELPIAGAKRRSNSKVSFGKEIKVRLGGMSVIRKDEEPLYVVDGTIIENRNNINTDDIEDISIL